MQFRDATGPHVSVLYTEHGVTLHQHGAEDDALVHRHPLGRAQHRHGPPAERYWRDQMAHFGDGYHARTLGGMR